MSSMIRIHRSALAVGLLACVGWCVGCRGGGPPTGQVTGQVTLKGEPLTSGTVILVNSDTGIGASSEIDSTGTYRIESVRTGDYQVGIQPPPAPSPEEMAEGAKVELSSIPVRYQDPQASGLTISVKQGENTADFELQ